MRNIGKADLQRDVGNSACAVARLGKQRESPLQSQLANACGEGCSGRLDQALQIARRDALTARHSRHGEPRLIEALGDVAERRAEAHLRDRAQATLAYGAVHGDGERDKIDDVPTDGLAYFRGSAQPAPFERSDVAACQLQSLGSPRQAPHYRVVGTSAACLKLGVRNHHPYIPEILT